MDQATPWLALADLVRPHYYDGRHGRPPYPLEVMLRIYFLQMSYHRSDRQVQEEIHEVPVFREFVGLSLQDDIPDEISVLRFRRLMERHELGKRMREWIVDRPGELGRFMKAGTVVDATTIEAPRSTKNRERRRDPEMGSTRKGRQWYFGLKAHIGADAETGTVHSIYM